MSTMHALTGVAYSIAVRSMLSSPMPFVIFSGMKMFQADPWELTTYLFNSLPPFLIHGLRPIGPTSTPALPRVTRNALPPQNWH
ncbi:hypothetical protein BJX96DRAFT_18632 [Aspergillus floccosus]